MLRGSGSSCWTPYSFSSLAKRESDFFLERLGAGEPQEEVLIQTSSRLWSRSLGTKSQLRASSSLRILTSFSQRASLSVPRKNLWTWP